MGGSNPIKLDAASQMQETIVLLPDKTGLSTASAMLQDGQLVAFPTETVYGLGANARNDRAVAQVFEAKGRPSFNPLIVHVADVAAAHKIAQFGAEADRLAAAFWPGPMTLVLPLLPQAMVSPLVTAGLESVALRVPEHPVAQGLLTAFGGPLAAPSANPSGRISPTRAQHVVQGLDGQIGAVIDGGACPVGVESTIIGLLHEPVLLRPGGLPLEAVEECLDRGVPYEALGAAPNAPGQLASHYAPSVPVRLNAHEAVEGEALLGFGPDIRAAALNLSPSGDLVEAAANLFHFLRKLDDEGCPIAVSTIPNKGLGRAINDRLKRAAAPKD